MATPGPSSRLRRLGAIILMVLSLAALILVGILSISNSQRATQWLARLLLLEVGQRTVAEMRILLLHARPPLELLHDRLREDPALGCGRLLAPDSPAWEGRTRLLAEALQAYPELWQMYFADLHGSFSLVTQAGPGLIRVEESWIRDGRTARRVYDLPGPGRATGRPESAPPYDPRERPWYREAVSKGSFTWTQPYVYIHGGQVGMSAVVPLMGPKGQALGVVGGDIPFQQLSRLLRLLPLGRPGLVFVIGADGRLVVAPTLDSTLREMPRALESDNPLIRAAAEQLSTRPWDSREPEYLVLQGAGGEHLGVAMPMESQPPITRKVVALVPRDDVMLPVETRNRMTAGVGLIGILACLLLWLRLQRLGADIARARHVGSYQLEKVLGTGGMGEVWRGRHRLLARPAAIKLVHPDAGPATGSNAPVPPSFRRFVREARATAALDSPHTIRVFDFGITDHGTFYYVMELLDGMDLERLVQRFGPLDPPLVVHLLRQACLSLEEAHAAGLVHRDIKPSNLFACRAGLEVDFVKVLDFGLVKHVEAADPGAARLTAANTFFGTPHYVAPEQALSRPVDGRADIYALACVGYWLLTGRTVFEGETVMQILVRHTGASPLPPSQHAPGVPAELDALLLRCLEKEPEKRPSARELAHLLCALPDLRPPGGEDRRRWWTGHIPREEAAQ